MLRDEAGPSGLVVGAEARAVVAVEVLVEEEVVVPTGSVWNFSAPPHTGRRPFSSGRKIDTSRRPSSSAISNSVISTPDPVGHSTLNSSP